MVDADEMMLIKVKMLTTKSILGRCCLETFEGSWNSLSHGALRLPVRHVVEDKGKGGVAANGLCNSEGGHS